jgi:L-asparaginase
MKLLVAATGGTIASLPDPETGAVRPAVSAEDLLTGIPELAEIAELDVIEVDRVNGWNVTPATMLRVANALGGRLGSDDYSGAIVTGGTDTIEETAFLLDLVLLSDKPVVLVGAMRTTSDASWDGPANLLAAVRVAASPCARGLGVLVVMDDHLLPAREVRKMHTESSGAFTTPEFGPLGLVDAGEVIVRRRPRARSAWTGAAAAPGLRVPALETRIDLLQAYTGMTDSLLRHLLEGGARGVSIVAFGRGNVPPALMPAIREAVDRGVVVTVSSRCPAGRVGARYGYDGGGLQLQQAGAILAGDLSGAKTRLLLMVALGGGSDPAAAHDFIQDTVS